MRRALIVGIEYYGGATTLKSPVNDAELIAARLRSHEGDRPNFACNLLLGKQGNPIKRGQLRRACAELFDPKFGDDVVFFFSGHGVASSTDGVLATSDAERDDWGVSMREVIDLANSSTARNVLILLDCCKSGEMGNAITPQSGSARLAVLREDVTVLAASMAHQPAKEMAGHGLFSSAVAKALDGGAADLLGNVTVSAIYSSVERRFCPWDQRPVFKSNATQSFVIRECAPRITRDHLRQLVKLFGEPDQKYPLDPEHEPEEPAKPIFPRNEAKVAIAKLFKTYRDVGLLSPTLPDEQLYWTARNSHTVELTPLGREFWHLAMRQRI
jgi:hypothetical protein